MRSASSIQLFTNPKPRKERKKKKLEQDPVAETEHSKANKSKRLTGKLKLLRVYVEELAGTHGGGIGGESPETKITVGFPAREPPS